jgi:hypothetical protein
MIYILLNCVLVVFFIWLTYFVDRTSKVQVSADDPLIVNILLASIISVLFLLLLTLEKIIPFAFSLLLLRLLCLLEGCFLVNISGGFIYHGWKRLAMPVRVAKVVLYVVVFYFVFFRFNTIAVYRNTGILIQSDYLFPKPLQGIFPWTWVMLYSVLFRFVLPGFCCLFMLLWNEGKATRLEKHQGYILSAGLVILWLVYAFVEWVSLTIPPFSLLFLYAYAVFLILSVLSEQQRSAASGSDTLMFVLNIILAYIVPALFAGTIYSLSYGLSDQYPVLFGIILVIDFGAAVVFSWIISRYLAKAKLLHSADYEQTFEKDLASIDYSGEMDEIIDTMFRIFKKNVECSSMAVFINNGQGQLDTAYSSDNKTLSISQNNPAFDLLLNINRNVVAYSQIENEHELDSAKDELAVLFRETGSDALFLLNEGRNILGLIVLGIKTSGDHYKEYDISVFTKLYSYFFVFGYYMRNISNKDIIGTVNREIRMSSQIITSIQENMDPIKNQKMDAGCIMVPAHNIGGEFIDLIRLNEYHHLFVVGDLSGKGIAASMSMVILKSIIRTFLAETHDFRQLIVRVNSFIRYSLQKGTIFAGLFALVDFKTDTMYYINCGCPALFLYTQAYNNVIEIQGSGHVLGFVSDITPYLTVKQIKLNKGDIVLSCTDGLINSHSLRGEQFGKERVQQALLANAMYPAQRMAQFEYDSLMKFMSKEMEDDVSVLVMKYQDIVPVVAEPETAEQSDSAGKEQENGTADNN